MASLLETESVVDGLRLLYRPTAKTRQISLSTYSKKLGYKSPRFVEMILKGDRAPSADFLLRTAELFSLSEVERLYLDLQTQRERAKSAGRTAEGWDRRIRDLKRKLASVSFIEPHFFTLFSEWYCLVIKQLLQANPQGLTVSQIVRKMRGKVKISEAEKALHTLLHLGIAARQEGAESFVAAQNTSLYTRPDIPSESVRKHHRQMMERAIEAQQEQGIADREMISLTFACNSNSLPKLKSALRRFRDEIDAEFGEGDSVFQLNLQLFSHTK